MRGENSYTEFLQFSNFGRCTRMRIYIKVIFNCTVGFFCMFSIDNRSVMIEIFKVGYYILFFQIIIYLGISFILFSSIGNSHLQ